MTFSILFIYKSSKLLGGFATAKHNSDALRIAPAIIGWRSPVSQLTHVNLIHTPAGLLHKANSL